MKHPLPSATVAILGLISLLFGLSACAFDPSGDANLEIRVRIPVDLAEDSSSAGGSKAASPDGGKLIHPLTRRVRAEISGTDFGTIFDEVDRAAGQTEVSLRLQRVPTGVERELLVTTYDENGLLLTGSSQTIEVSLMTVGSPTLVSLQAAVDAPVGLGSSQPLPAVPAETVAFARFTLVSAGYPLRVSVRDSGSRPVAGLRIYYDDARSVPATRESATGDYIFTPAQDGDYSVLIPGTALTAAGGLTCFVQGNATCSSARLFEGYQPERELSFSFNQPMVTDSLVLNSGFGGSPAVDWGDEYRSLTVYNANPNTGTVDFSLSATDAMTGASHTFSVRAEVRNFIFVTASGISGFPGTRSQPTSFLSNYSTPNIGDLGGGPCVFVMASGEYSVSALTFLDGVELWGGYEATGWTRAAGSRAILNATNVSATYTFTGPEDSALVFRGISFRRTAQVSPTANSGTTERSTIYLNNCNLDMVDCEVVLQDLVTSGTSPLTTVGAPTNIVNGIKAVSLSNGKRISIDRSRITGGRYADTGNIAYAVGYGIHCSSSATNVVLVLSNSLVDPLATATSIPNIEDFSGVWATGVKAVLVGNTIMEGYGLSYNSTGVYLAVCPDSILVNNLFLPINSQSNRGVHLFSGTPIALFRNNYLGLIKYVPSGNTVYYMRWVESGVYYYPASSADMNAPGAFADSAGGNVAVQFNPLNTSESEPLLPYLQKIFLDPDGSYNDPLDFLGRDYRPVASSAGLVAGGDAFRAGGLDLSDWDVYLATVPGIDPAYYTQFMYDYSGALRTAGSWSIGAYQYP